MFGAVDDLEGGGGASTAGSLLGGFFGGPFGAAAGGAALGALGGILGRRSAKKRQKQLEDMIRRRTATEGVLAADAAQSSVDEAKHQLKDTYGDIDGSLVDRGMYNTTVRDSLHAGASAELGRVIGQIRSRQADRVSQINREGYDQLLGVDEGTDPIAGQVGQLAYLALQRQPRYPNDDGTMDPVEPGGVGGQVAGDVQRSMDLASMGGVPGADPRHLSLARAYLNGRRPSMGGDH